MSTSEYLHGQPKGRIVKYQYVYLGSLAPLFFSSISLTVTGERRWQSLLAASITSLESSEGGGTSRGAPERRGEGDAGKR